MNEHSLNSPEKHMPLIEISRAKPGVAETLCDIRDRAWIGAYVNEELRITGEDIKLKAQGIGGEFVSRRIAYLENQFTTDDGNGLSVLVAKSGNAVLGYIEPRIDERGRRQISTLYVAPEAQNMGIGSKLIQRAIDMLGRDQDIFLDVVAYNQNAINFYERFGFKKTDATVPQDNDAPDYIKPLPEIEMVLRALLK